MAELLESLLRLRLNICAVWKEILSSYGKVLGILPTPPSALQSPISKWEIKPIVEHQIRPEWLSLLALSGTIELLKTSREDSGETKCDGGGLA